MSGTTLGQELFRRIGPATGNATWDDLSPRLQRGWNQVADEIVDIAAKRADSGLDNATFLKQLNETPGNKPCCRDPGRASGSNLTQADAGERTDQRPDLNS